MSAATDIDAINAYLQANPGRTGPAVSAFTNWVVWYSKHGTADADVTRARALLTAFDTAQGGKPLAPGLYWIDLLSTDALATFTAWRRAYGVKVTQTNEQQSPYRAWVQFQVSAPAMWANPSGGPGIDAKRRAPREFMLGAFGWHILSVVGHDVESIARAHQPARRAHMSGPPGS